jgi:hypothetical protein
MAIDFPNTPTNGDTFSAGGKNWQYNGTGWVLQGVVPTIPNASIGSTQLADTAVTAGSYTTANITVDAQGRLTAASTGNGFDAFDDQVFLATQIWS